MATGPTYACHVYATHVSQFHELHTCTNCFGIASWRLSAPTQLYVACAKYSERASTLAHTVLCDDKLPRAALKQGEALKWRRARFLTGPTCACFTERPHNNNEPSQKNENNGDSANDRQLGLCLSTKTVL